MESGECSKVKVWLDPWLRDGNRGFVTSLIALGVENLLHPMVNIVLAPFIDVRIMESLVDNTDVRVEDNWTKLWHLKVSKKVKVFL